MYFTARHADLRIRVDSINVEKGFHWIGCLWKWVISRVIGRFYSGKYIDMMGSLSSIFLISIRYASQSNHFTHRLMIEKSYSCIYLSLRYHLSNHALAHFFRNFEGRIFHLWANCFMVWDLHRSYGWALDEEHNSLRGNPKISKSADLDVLS